MSISDLAKTVEKFTVANSPTILTAVAVTGTITTAILAGKASYKAATLIEAEERRREHLRDISELPESAEEPMDATEKVELVWTLFIPAVGTAITTCIAMVAANQIGTRRAAAMAVAYSMSEKAFGEYKDKVTSKFGEKKEQSVRDELAQDRVNKKTVESTQVVMIGDGEVLCFEQYSGRYFNSTMETIKKAQNDLNYKILNESYASLNDFYDLLGLDTLASGEEVGWTTEKKLDIFFSTVLSTDQRPCIAIDFTMSPVRNYYKGY